MSSFEPLLDVLTSLLTLGVIGLSAYGLGRPGLRKLAIAEADSLAVGVWSLALGLLLAGSLLLLLSAVACLNPFSIGLLTLVSGLWGAGELACSYLGLVCARLVPIPREPEAAPSYRALPLATQFAVLAGGFVVLTSFVGALAPPTSPTALQQCLEIPKNVLRFHSLGENSGLSAVPNLAEMWFLWALSLDGPVAASLLHWGVGLLTAMATVLLARPVLGHHPALLAACVLLLCPGVSYQMTAPLEDLGLALFTTLAMCAAWQAIMQMEPHAWPVAAGLMLGGATAVNGSDGIAFGAAFGGVWAYSCWLQREGRDNFGLAAYSMILATIVAGGPWLLAAGPLSDGSSRQTVQSVMVHLGPVLIVVIPGLLFARRLRGMNVVLAVIAAYSVLAVLTPGVCRWWSPLAPLASLAAAWAWQELDQLPRFARLASVCTISTLALWSLQPAIDRATFALPTAVGWQSRDAYLLARHPSYRAASLLNSICRPDDRVLCQSAPGFYFSCSSMVAQNILPSICSENVVPVGRDLQSAVMAAGYSYLLVAEPVGDDSQTVAAADKDAPLHPAACGAVQQLARNPQVIPILEYYFADDDNRCIRYRLLKIR